MQIQKNTPVALWVQIVDAVLVFLLIIEIGIDIHVYGHVSLWGSRLTQRYFYKLSNIFDLAVVFTAVIGAALLFLEYRGLSTIDTRIAVTLLCVRYLFQTARWVRQTGITQGHSIPLRCQTIDDTPNANPASRRRGAAGGGRHNLITSPNQMRAPSRYFLR